MKSIFRYPGGKTKPAIQNWIISHAPAGCREYREAFVGGGGVFFGLYDGEEGGLCEKPRRFETVWLNDKHEGLIAVYTALRDRPEQFIAACREIQPPQPCDPMTPEGERGGEPKNARLSAKFDELKLNTECDQALRYYFVNRTVHGSGRVNYDIPSRLYFSNPDGWNITATNRLEQASRALRGAKITCGDYEDVLSTPGRDVWIYLDPPYVVNGNLTPSSQLYQHSFGTQDHRRFANAVSRCEHKVCVSYDADKDDFVRVLFEDPKFRIVEGSWKYAGTTEGKKKSGRELLIMNYDPPGGRLTIHTLEVIDGLDSNESITLRECEAAIEDAIGRGRESFVEIGKALAAIRDSGQPSKRLYRATHATFKDYCRDRWPFSKSQCDRFIAGYRMVEALKMTPVGGILPATERQVRELARLESDGQAADVWQKVVDSVSGPKEITAAVIRKHVNEAIGYERPEPPDKVESVRRALMSLSPEQRFQLLQEFIPKAEAA